MSEEAAIVPAEEQPDAQLPFIVVERQVGDTRFHAVLYTHAALNSGQLQRAIDEVNPRVLAVEAPGHNYGKPRSKPLPEDVGTLPEEDEEIQGTIRDAVIDDDGGQKRDIEFLDIPEGHEKLPLIGEVARLSAEFALSVKMCEPLRVARIAMRQYHASMATLSVARDAIISEQLAGLPAKYGDADVMPVLGLAHYRALEGLGIPADAAALREQVMPLFSKDSLCMEAIRDGGEPDEALSECALAQTYARVFVRDPDDIPVVLALLDRDDVDPAFVLDPLEYRLSTDDPLEVKQEKIMEYFDQVLPIAKRAFAAQGSLA